MLSFAEGPDGLLSPFVIGTDVDVVGGPFVIGAAEGMIVDIATSGNGEKSSDEIQLQVDIHVRRMKASLRNHSRKSIWPDVFSFYADNGRSRELRGVNQSNVDRFCH